MTERDLQAEAVAHRSGETDPSGKRVVRLEVLITEQMNDELIAAAVALRMPKTELARLGIELALRGWVGVMRRNLRGDGE